ncbi:MFS transporter [Calidifontibacter terrae]
MTASVLDTSRPENTGRAIANTIKGSLGNLVEWYDVYTYTVFVSYFEDKFFDPADKNSTLYAYAIFAVTFLARPLGSWWFGRYADRHGRRTALTLSVSIMAAGSLLIAIMPTRGSIGVWAAIGLTVIRLIQGFATGGEYGTSATYMSEAATRGRRGFFSSFQYVTLVGGQVLAQLVLLIMQSTIGKSAIGDYGWRIAFGIGAVAAVIVFWLRTTMDESLSKEHLEAVSQGQDSDSGSMRELLTKHLWPLILVFLITAGGTLAFYVYSVNSPGVVKKAYDGSTGTWINLLALVVLMIMQPIGGMISDRIGRKPMLIFFGVGGVIYTYFLVTYLPKQHSEYLSFLMLVIGFIILTGYTSINAIVKAELFPAHIRALGVGLGYGLANSVFGGTAPLIYQAMKAHHRTAFIVYATFVIAVSLVVYIVFLKNKAQTHLDREQGHAFEVG